jgi:acetyltransferase EpsM
LYFDCKIGHFAHLSPGVALAGNVTVGEGTHVGIGSCVIQGITIGKWVTIGAGAVIIKDVPDYAVVVGNPGIIIKFNLQDE